MKLRYIIQSLLNWIPSQWWRCQGLQWLLEAVTQWKSDQPPALSLANNLWIRHIPWELQVLTFPEQLLIALLYPCVYVFKLFPKDVHYWPENSMLQWGMCGTVSTYNLNMDGAISMVQGDLMPCPTVILPSVISVTFIGWGDLPKYWLWTTFHVCHQVIFEALRWLKTHNTKYYGHITIDLDCIHQLPEDDVPAEILGVIQLTTDMGLIDQESVGYMPMDNDERAGKQWFYHIWRPQLTFGVLFRQATNIRAGHWCCNELWQSPWTWGW